MSPSPRLPVLLSILAAAVLPAGCGSSHAAPRQVALTVIVHDHDGFAWQNVEVRILEAWTEYSACLCTGREPWIADRTDRNGEVLFDPQALALGELGFEERPAGIAVLSPDPDRDEAVVKLLVGHDEIGWVRLEVPLTFDDPQVDVFVEID